MNLFDLAIIGGGPAGMSAALVAGRARLRTLVVNAEQPRNAVTAASHGFLTRDGAHPDELLAVAKAQLSKYPSVRYVQGKVEEVSPGPGGFALRMPDGPPAHAQRVILATGYKDDLAGLALPGLDEVYGTSVFPCPFCDGFEHADERLALFGSQGIEHFAPVVRIWSENLVVFTNGVPLDEPPKAQLEQRGIRVVEATVARLLSEGGILRAVVLQDGMQIERDAGFIADDYSMPATRFAESLGIGKTTNDWGAEVPDTDSSGKTTVEGLYVIGDATSGFSGLVEAAAEGSGCVKGIVHELAVARWG